MAVEAKLKRALISVYDKTGVVEFARELAALGIEIVSTGGTARLLRDAGISVRDVAELTGWPEMLGGRVKTLHPKVHGGILFQRGKAEDRKQVAEHGIGPIDLVVVNLYPFSATAAKPGVTAEELIENIDIGGPAMVRSAAKNFQSVGVVTDPADYAALAAELRENGELSLATRLALARKAYARTARYDGEIATELERLSSRTERSRSASSKSCPSAFTSRSNAASRCATARIRIRLRRSIFRQASRRQGSRARSNFRAKSFPTTIWSTSTPRGRSRANSIAPASRSSSTTIPAARRSRISLRDAYLKALECDPVSAFGGVLAFNRAIDAATAEEVAKLFVECIVAPGYEPRRSRNSRRRKICGLLEMPRELAAHERSLTSSGSRAACWCRNRTATSSAKRI